jgi:hypothetical protein
MKNKKELEQIAKDLFHDKLFTNRHIKNPEDVAMVFMPLALMTKKQLLALKKKKIGMIFEHMDKAAPRSINGMPCFFSMQVLSEDDTKIVIELYQKLKKAEAGAYTIVWK